MKRILSFLLVLCLMGGLCTAMAQKDRILTLERAVQIDDYHIVLEFSEPIAINLKGSNRGPHCSIRVVGSNYTLKWTGQTNYSTALQFNGALEYVDDKHDRLLFSLTSRTFGIAKISEITGFEGKLEPYSEYKTAMCLEEVPFETDTLINNGHLDNITTADGSVYLWSNRPGGWDGCYADIEIDYSYKIDLTKTESIETVIEHDQPVFALGQEAEPEPEPEPEPIPVQVQNNPLIFAAFVAVGAVVGVVGIVVGVIVRKRKAVKK